MKTNFLENKIEIVPENIFEEAYLCKFIFEISYGEFLAENINIPNSKTDKLIKLIIPGKESNVQ